MMHGTTNIKSLGTLLPPSSAHRL